MNATAKDSFVPLSQNPAAKTNPADFQVLMAPRPENARSLRELTPLAANGSSGCGPSPEAKPRVTVHREGSVITGIHIQCSCGQVIDLKCSYSENDSGVASAPKQP